jgi:2-dehydropantoate 2-reductase
MRIAVMATGALGGYFGARMAAAGHDVFFIARGANLEALRNRALKVESVLGDLHLANPNVTDDPKKIGMVDSVLFTVKLWDTEKAAEQARPLIGPDTRVITLQNGVDSPERLIPILGDDIVVAGSAYIAVTMSAPGIVTHTSNFARIVCGRIDGRPDGRLAAFVDAAHAAQVDVTLSDAIDRERWQKFVFLVALAGATGSTRMALGPILEDTHTRALFHDLMREVVAVGRAKGVSLPADLADERMRFAETTPPTFKASLLHDLERGNRLELDWLTGKVVDLGRTLGVPTPTNDAVYAVLKLHRMGRAASEMANRANPLIS